MVPSRRVNSHWQTNEWGAVGKSMLSPRRDETAISFPVPSQRFWLPADPERGGIRWRSWVDRGLEQCWWFGRLARHPSSSSESQGGAVDSCYLCVVGGTLLPAQPDRHACAGFGTCSVCSVHACQVHGDKMGMTLFRCADCLATAGIIVAKCATSASPPHLQGV
jgi:hypothetical protein